jgi:hypothetical protein
MLRLLADEDFTRMIFEAVRSRSPQLDFVRAQDLGIMAWPDESVLQWAAVENRVVVSHDVNTMRRAANDLVASGQAMAGVVLVRQSAGFQIAVEQLQWLAEESDQDELQGQVVFLPF